MKFEQSLRTIQSKLLLLLLTILIPILLIEAVIYVQRFHTRRNEELQTNLEVARVTAEMFDTFVRDVLREESAIGKAFTLPQPLSVLQMQTFLDGHLVDYPAIFNINWVDANGQVVASTNHEAIGMDVGDRDYIRDIMDGAAWNISNLLLSRATGQPIFAISRGIRDDAGILLGMVVAVVNPDRLDEMFAIERSAKGALAILDREGRVVYRYPEIQWTWEERQWLRTYPLITEGLEGKEVTTMVEHDVDGVKRILALTPASFTHWLIIASRPYEEVMGPVLSYLFRHAGLFLLVTLPAFLAALTISRTIANPVKNLCRHAQALGRGDLNGKVEMDASGPSELLELATAFNDAAEQVRIREDALHTARDQLELRVHERTSELANANEALRAEVAERKKAEDAAKLERERLFSLLNNLPAFVLVATPDYSVRFVNEYFRNHFGEITTRTCYGVHGARREPCDVCQAGDVFRTQKPREWEWSDHANGRSYHVYGYPFTDFDKSPLVLMLGIDITERKRAEAALEEQRILLETILRQATDAIVVSDAEGKYVFANDASKRLARRDPEGASLEDVASVWGEILGSDAHTIATEEWCLAKALRGHFTVGLEARVVHPDGSSHDLLIGSAPLRKTNGSIIGAVATFSDVTELKRTEERLRVSLAQSKERQAEVAALLEASRSLLENRDLRTATQSIYFSCKELLGATVGYMALASQEAPEGEILLWDSGGQICPEGSPLPMCLLELCQRTCQCGSTLYQNDLKNLEQGGPVFPGSMPLESMLIAPLLIEQKSVGWIGVANKPGGFGENDARLASAFGELASIALFNSQTLHALQASEDQLRSLSSRLLRAQEEERKRIAGELHDSVGSSLSAIKLFLENALAKTEQGTATPEALQRLIDISQDTIQDLRRIMTDLRPSILDDFGLVLTIDWFCCQFQMIHSEIHVEKNLCIDEGEIPESLKIVIFRIVQEALHNIAKHSRADFVRISLTRDDNHIRLVVEDTGVGFDTNCVVCSDRGKKGMGLAGMRERAELSGGKFLLQSEEGVGTKVQATWRVG